MVRRRSLQGYHPLPQRPTHRHTAPRSAFHLLCASLLTAYRGSAFLLDNAPPQFPPSSWCIHHGDHVRVHRHHQPRAVITVSRGTHRRNNGGSHSSSSSSGTQTPRQELRNRLPTRPACFLAGATSGRCSHTHKINNRHRTAATSAPSRGGGITLPTKRTHENPVTGINTSKCLKNRGDIVVAFCVPPAHVGSALRAPNASDGVEVGGRSGVAEWDIP